MAMASECMLMASECRWWPLSATDSSLVRASSQTKRYLRQAAEDSVDAYEIDPSYLKAYLRAAEAHLALNERTTVKLAVHELETALKMDPDNDKIKAQLKDAQLTWEADWAD